VGAVSVALLVLINVGYYVLGVVTFVRWIWS
jgi:hypothetical protein